MEKIQFGNEARNKPVTHGRSFAKDIAELALYLEITEGGDPALHMESATLEVAHDRAIPHTTLKRCSSEARALVDHAHENGVLPAIDARGDRSEWVVRGSISAWLDEVSLTAVLKQRALRLNRSRGGRPASQTRTLRAVQELLAYAQAGRPGALDELRSIRALVSDA